ncbi:hypothetical protein KDX27_31480 [Burkholderia cenocepacia]|uniref:hypothetical protein n=1 Tax=Burkholderia cenocepacia TaxID=95486 RepID=UPI001B9002BC|nr:hypothetical protein [Burkholderia cenocepacia]MBR8028563.1 hypothetical protein [Burkholderia cenocepacia]MBR8172261.1 hypothetical protein [Burkholderia cenocepacia]
MSAAAVNHALEAAGHHAMERLGIDPHGRHAAAARAHAKQAGRQLAVAGYHREAASPHITANPPLHDDHEAGYFDGENARFAIKFSGAGGLDAAGLDACLQARAAFDQAVHTGDADAVQLVMDTIFGIAAKYPRGILAFFDDVPEVEDLRRAAVAWRTATDAHDAARAEADARQAQWEASLPTAAELMRAVAAEANGEGTSFDFQGYTLWHEPDHGGWSLTNAYGVDHCRFLTSERDFQQLIDTVRRRQDIGPVPPGCEIPDEPVEDDSYIDAMTACYEAETALLARLGLSADAPVLDAV